MTEQTTQSTPPAPDGTALPPPARSRRPPWVGPLLLWLQVVAGVLFPAGVILFEWSTGFCASLFFDPLPTPYHLLLTLAVPAANGWMLWHLHGHPPALRGTVGVAGGLALAVGGYYSLVFSPLLPLAAIAVLFYGMGLLPMAPVAALVVVGVSLWRLRKRLPGTLGRRLGLGVALGLVALAWMDLPAAYTNHVLRNPERMVDPAAAADALRTVHSRAELVRAAYGEPGQVIGPLAALRVFGRGGRRPTPAEAREVFFRVTGEAFNTEQPEPKGSSWSPFGFAGVRDPDVGADGVGGRVPTLRLVGSALNGSVNDRAALAYLEWRFEVRNTGQRNHEARLLLRLPPGGVVSRATLWVRGEPREASIAQVGAARAAYESIVRVRRDPLLVTDQGVGQVLAQVFPVPADGTVVRFQLGITVPLLTPSAPGADGATLAVLALPELVDANLEPTPELRHGVWIEAETALSSPLPALVASTPQAALHRMEGRVPPDVLGPHPAAGGSGPPPQVRLMRRPVATPLWAPARQDAPNGPVVVLRPVTPGDEAEAGAAAPPLVVVLDASRGAEPAADALREALTALPPERPLGLVLATEPARSVAPAPWGPAQREAVERLLADAEFQGGTNNLPALADALRLLEAAGGGDLLWLHGVQPVVFEAGHAHLAQVALHLTTPVRVHSLSIDGAPNRLARTLPAGVTPEAWPRLGPLVEDVRMAVLRPDSGPPRPPVPTLLPTRPPGLTEAQRTSAHLARLWAHEEVLRLWRAGGKAGRKAAVRLAAAHGLVTPVTAAVVLETDREYGEHKLPPPDPDQVPAIPEPHTWALLAVVLGLLGWLALRARQGRRHGSDA